ncbi:MAG: APC family permease [Thermoplasmataceae archaeon]
MAEEKVIDYKRSLMQSFSSIGPFLDIAAIFASIIIVSSILMPFEVLVAFLISYSSIYSIYYISSQRSNNGGYYSFVGKSLGKGFGILTAILYVFYSSMVLPNISLFIANFISSATLNIGFSFSFQNDIYAIFFSFLTIITVSKGLKFSSLFTLVLGILEICIMGFYIIFFAVSGNGVVNIIQNPNLQSFFIGIMFGMVIFAGSGSSIFISENTNEPTKTVPKAIIVSYTLSGIILVLAAFSMENFLGISGSILYANSGGTYILVKLMNYSVWLFIIFLSLTVISGFNLAVSFLRALIQVLKRMRVDKIIPSWNLKIKDESGDLLLILILNIFIIGIANIIGFFNLFLILLTLVAISYLLIHIITSFAVIRDSVSGLKIKGILIPTASSILLSTVLYYELTFEANIYANAVMLAVVSISVIIVLILNKINKNFILRLSFKSI